MLTAEGARLPVRLHQGIARIANLRRSEHETTDLELLDELLFEKSRALLLVKCDQNPVFLAHLLEELCVGGGACKEFPMPFVSNARAVQLFGQLVVIEVVVEIEREPLKRRFSFLRAKSLLRSRFRVDHSLSPIWKSRPRPSCGSSETRSKFWN